MSKHHHVVSLEVDGLKRIRALRIVPETGDPLVVIGGRNAQGKTSVLDALEIVLSGGKKIPDKPIREGQSRAKIRADLGEFTITRTITEKGGGTLKVEYADGRKIKSPQAFLDELTGKYVVDPVQFLNAHPKEQADTLRQLAGVQTHDLDEEYETNFSERTVINRQVKAAKAKLDAATFHEDTPEDEVVISVLAKELEEANQAVRTASDLKQRVTDSREKRRNRRLSIAAVESELESLKAELKNDSTRISEAEASAEKAAERVQDTEELRGKLDQAEVINHRVRENQTHRALTVELEDSQKEATDLDIRLQEIDHEKLERIRKAKFPVPDLSLDDQGVTFKGVPLAQASSAEQLRVSVAVALANKPGIRVLLIRTGSLLDDENLALLADLAEENSAQVWIEIVGVNDETSFEIVDGELRD